MIGDNQTSFLFVVAPLDAFFVWLATYLETFNEKYTHFKFSSNILFLISVSNHHIFFISMSATETSFFDESLSRIRSNYKCRWQKTHSYCAICSTFKRFHYLSANKLRKHVFIYTPGKAGTPYHALVLCRLIIAVSTQEDDLLSNE